MKILLYIYLGISAITILTHTFATLSVECEFKNRHPDIKVPKASLIQRIFTRFRVLVISFIPIVNLVMLLTYIFKYEKLVDSSIEKVLSSVSKEGTDE